MSHAMSADNADKIRAGASAAGKRKGETPALFALQRPFSRSVMVAEF